MYKSERYQSASLFHVLRQPRCIAPAAEGGYTLERGERKRGGSVGAAVYGRRSEGTVAAPGRHGPATVGRCRILIETHVQL